MQAGRAGLSQGPKKVEHAAFLGVWLQDRSAYRQLETVLHLERPVWREGFKCSSPLAQGAELRFS